MNGTSEKKILRKKLAASSIDSEKDYTISYLKKNLVDMQQKMKQQDQVSSLLASTHMQMQEMKHNYSTQVSSLKSQLSHESNTHMGMINNLDAKLNEQMLHIKKEYEKKLEDSLRLLSDKVDYLNNMQENSIDLLKGAIDARVGASSAHASQHASEIESLKNDLQKYQIEIASIENEINNYKQEIAFLRQKIASIPTSNGYLLVGDQFNLPEQPNVSKEGGVYKDAPLSMAVHGGIVLHDIGYTTKKGLPLILDPETQRLLVYHGK